MIRAFREVLLLIAAVMLVIFIESKLPDPVFAQTTQQTKLDKQGRMPGNGVPSLVTWSPADLNMNAVALGGSVSITTPIIDIATVHSSTFSFNCGQVVTVSVVTFDDAEPAVARGTYIVDTSAATGWQQIFIATELAPNVTSGTNTIQFRLPQRKIQFSILNTTVTATTCSAGFAANYF